MEWRWCGVSWGKFLQSDPCTGQFGCLICYQELWFLFCWEVKFTTLKRASLWLCRH